MAHTGRRPGLGLNPADCNRSENGAVVACGRPTEGGTDRKTASSKNVFDVTLNNVVGMGYERGLSRTQVCVDVVFNNVVGIGYEQGLSRTQVCVDVVFNNAGAVRGIGRGFCTQLCEQRHTEGVRIAACPGLYTYWLCVECRS